MPSVASEVHQSLSAHARKPSARSQPDADAPSTPFAEMLDSAAPAAPSSSASHQARPDRAEAADRPKTAKPDDKKSADTAPTRNDRADTKGPKGAKDAAGADGAKNGADAKDAATKDSKDAQAADADAVTDKPKAGVDVAVALDAAFVDTPTPAAADPQAETVAAVLPVAAPVDPAPSAPIPAAPIPADVAPAADAASENGAIAAVQVAGAKAADKTGQPEDITKSPAKTDTRGDKQVKPEQAATDTSTDAQAAAPKSETASKEEPAHASKEEVPAAVRHAAAELLKKLDPDAPAPHGADAAVKVGAEAVQNLGGVTHASATSSTNAASAVTPTNTPAQASPAVPLAGLAVEIATQATAGKHHFEIRLDPPELGRIDVRLDVDRDGNVSTKLIADRNDTLDLLKRDASQLERALQDAGLKTSDNTLQFSLRQEGFAHGDTPGQNSAQLVVPDDDPAPLEALRQGYGRMLGLGGGLDIRV